MVRNLFIVLLFCCITAFAQFAQQKPVSLAPSFQGNAFPSPPMQNAPWPHDDDSLSNAAATLFDQGLADPRGLEYREIEIAVGNPWNGGGYPLKTHGWILPKKNNSDQFAVAWNGLIYPVLQVGAVADLDKDWAAIPARSVEASKYIWRSAAVSETNSANFTFPSELKMVMLRRLGKSSIVKRIYKSAHSEATDPYLGLANDWAWLAFERAVCAHERGDDHLTLAAAQMLTRIQPLIDAEAKRRGFKHPQDQSNTRFPNSTLPYLPFLKQLPALLKDGERRVAQEKNPLTHKDDIPGLIDDLQNVDARQSGQPGGVSLAQDKRVQALVKRGNEIMEPLLNTIENDTRLTRSVSFGRDFARDRHLIPVSQAAYAAIKDLLQVHFKDYDENGEPLSKEKLISKIRDYWNKMKTLSPAERFYSTLKDDKASKDQWLQAAANIVQPTDVETHGNWTTIPNRKSGEEVALRGESLRDGRVPSVSQLLAKRSDDIAAMDKSFSTYHFVFLNAAEVALNLSRWDKPAAIPILTKRLASAMNFNPQPEGHVLMMVAKLTNALACCGDETAYDNYAVWIKKIDLKSVFYEGEELQKPLIAGRAHPSIQRAINYLFNNPKSALYDSFTENTILSFYDFWKSPLPLTTAFRKKAMRALANKNNAGTITFNPRKNWTGSSEANIKIGNFGFGYRGSNGDPDTPPAGEKRSFRVCDAYAYFYSQYQDGPKIQLFWPVEKRDASVAECRKWLKEQK